MKKAYIEILEKQLAIDYDCSVEDLHSKENIYRILKVFPTVSSLIK